MQEKFWTSGTIFRLSLLAVALVLIVNYERKKRQDNL
jgi:hypothetical protein